MSINAKNLISLIKKIVKEEVKKTVKNEINAVLAERFIASINQKTIVTEAPSPPPPKQFQQKQISQDRRKDLLKKMGIDENPMLQMIYEDVSSAPAPAQPVVINGMAVPVDSDDEGIDLSQFGLGD